LEWIILKVPGRTDFCEIPVTYACWGWRSEASKWLLSGMYHLECCFFADENHSTSQANRLARRELCRPLWRPHYGRLLLIEQDARGHAPRISHKQCVFMDEREGILNWE
jgi:hypothetical protein